MILYEGPFLLVKSLIFHFLMLVLVVALQAHAEGVEHAIFVWTCGCQAASTIAEVALAAHALGIVLCVCVRAPIYFLDQSWFTQDHIEKFSL